MYRFLALLSPLSSRKIYNRVRAFFRGSASVLLYMCTLGYLPYSIGYGIFIFSVLHQPFIFIWSFSCMNFSCENANRDQIEHYICLLGTNPFMKKRHAFRCWNVHFLVQSHLLQSLSCSQQTCDCRCTWQAYSKYCKNTIGLFSMLCGSITALAYTIHTYGLVNYSQNSIMYYQARYTVSTISYISQALHCCCYKCLISGGMFKVRFVSDFFHKSECLSSSQYSLFYIYIILLCIHTTGTNSSFSFLE